MDDILSTDPPRKARLTRMVRGNVAYPAAFCDGNEPSVGEEVQILVNGQGYAGIVLAYTGDGIEWLIEFADGLQPLL